MITSRQNSLVKQIKGLADKKNRDLSGLYVIEGYKSVKEAVECGVKISTLVFTESGKSLFGDTALPFETVTDGVFACFSGEKSPQGVIAVAEKPKNEIVSPKGNSLFLDGVSDPANVGAIIRTAAASGYNDVYLADCADAFGPKAVRTSMSGLFKVRTHSGTREQLLKVIDKPIVVADMYGKNVFDLSIKGDVTLVIGNEAHGVSEELKSLSEYTVKIPMENGMESLNAAVSAGILMYAVKNRK